MLVQMGNVPETNFENVIISMRIVSKVPPSKLYET